MNVTKYEHACLVLEEQGARLVVDPGMFARGLGAVRQVAGIVITHAHSDHFDAANVATLVKNSPDARIFATQETAAKLGGRAVTVVSNGSAAAAGPFALRFFGEWHACVFDNKPHEQNVGVLVNGQLYYPGDSFTLPNARPAVLALPSSGPWLKTGEAIEFLRAVRPSERCFPTHDAYSSEAGMRVANEWLADACAEAGITFRALKPGETVTAD